MRSKDPPTELARLLAIMAQLRNPQTGCEWDREQTFQSIAPYTIEEAYEVADAITRNDLNDLRDELGDLLLQVVFHARMAEEAGYFDFEAVTSAICDKLEKRHPHIFGDEIGSTERQSDRWEKLKAQERSEKGASSAMDGVALSLPALMRAEKLQKRAARVGFDWPDSSGPSAKIIEEMEELAEAEKPEERLMEAGDLLFAAVNLVRSLGIAPEDALRAANSKFEGRFRAMEEMAARGENIFSELSLEEQESHWQAVKDSE